MKNEESSVLCQKTPWNALRAYKSGDGGLEIFCKESFGLLLQVSIFDGHSVKDVLKGPRRQALGHLIRSLDAFVILDSGN